MAMCGEAEVEVRTPLPALRGLIECKLQAKTHPACAAYLHITVPLCHCAS